MFAIDCANVTGMAQNKIKTMHTRPCLENTGFYSLIGIVPTMNVLR